MSNVKRALGRGLADLIPVGGGEGAGAPEGPGREVPVASLHPNPRQPRTRFDDEALGELAASIRSNGFLPPILVRPRTAGGFEIVAGERRYRAALRAGLGQVPVIVRTLTDQETLALALVENLLREDISPLESARAFHRLIHDFGLTQEEMAQRVGKSRAAVTNTLRLLDLPADIQDSLQKGEITEGHARALLHKGAPKELQRKVWQLARTRGLSVREVERRMKEHDAAPAAPAARVSRASADMAEIGDRLRRSLGTKVRVVGDESRGHIEIAYFSADELDGLINRLEGEAPEPHDPPLPTRGSGPIQGLRSSRRPVR